MRVSWETLIWNYNVTLGKYEELEASRKDPAGSNPRFHSERDCRCLGRQKLGLFLTRVPRRGLSSWVRSPHCAYTRGAGGTTGYLKLCRPYSARVWSVKCARRWRCRNYRLPDFGIFAIPGLENRWNGNELRFSLYRFYASVYSPRLNCRAKNIELYKLTIPF